ncbi:tobamovirus multiplication 2A, partial [Olea europaea subsp. europaea]
MYKNAASSGHDVPIAPPGGEFVQLGHPMLISVSLTDSIVDKLPKAWLWWFTNFSCLRYGCITLQEILQITNYLKPSTYALQ